MARAARTVRTAWHGIGGGTRPGGFRRPAGPWSVRPSAACDHGSAAPTQGSPAWAAPQRCRLARSSLKMKRVDPARARVSAQHGVGDVAGLEGGGYIGSQVGPAAFDGSGLSFRSAIHLHGSTPHRESGVVSGARAGDMRRSPTGQARPHALPVTGDRQVLERMAGAGAAASGAGTASARTASRFKERPAMNAGKSQTSALRTMSTKARPRGLRQA